MISRKVVVAATCVLIALATVVVLEALIYLGYLIRLDVEVRGVTKDWGGYVVKVKVVNTGLGTEPIKYLVANGVRLSDLGVIVEVPNQHSLLLKSLGNEEAAGAELLISEIPLIKKSYPSWEGLPINSTYPKLVISERVKVIKLSVVRTNRTINLRSDYRGVILLDTYFWNVYRGPESFTSCRALFRLINESTLQAAIVGYFRGWEVFRVHNVSTIKGINLSVPHTLTIELTYSSKEGLVIKWLVDGELVGKEVLSNVIELVLWDVMSRWYPKYGYLANLMIDDLEITLYKSSIPIIYVHAVYEEEPLPNYVVFPTGYTTHSLSSPGFNALHHVVGGNALVSNEPIYLYIKLPSKYFRSGNSVRLSIVLGNGRTYYTEFKLP